MPSVDLFDWIDALYTKKRLPGTPPVWVMHRFLASDRDLADAVRIVQRDLRGDEITYRVWQGLLPRGRSAPRFRYPAPKKPPAEEALVARVMEVESYGRAEAEAAVDMLRLTERIDEAEVFYGVGEES